MGNVTKHLSAENYCIFIDHTAFILLQYFYRLTYSDYKFFLFLAKIIPFNNNVTIMLIVLYDKKKTVIDSHLLKFFSISSLFDYFAMSETAYCFWHIDWHTKHIRYQSC